MVDWVRKAIDDIYKFPLFQTALDTLNRQLKSGISDYELAKLVAELRADGRLCQISDEQPSTEPSSAPFDARTTSASCARS